MSETETRKGKMVEIQTDDLETQCKTLCEQSSIEKGEYYDTWVEVIKDGGLGGYAVIDNRLFQLLADKHYEYEDIFEANKNKDGTIDYLVRYYNGGCGFEEALEYALKNMEKP